MFAGYLQHLSFKMAGALPPHPDVAGNQRWMCVFSQREDVVDMVTWHQQSVGRQLFGLTSFTLRSIGGDRVRGTMCVESVFYTTPAMLNSNVEIPGGLSADKQTW